MDSRSTFRMGSVCALLVGISYVVTGLAYLLMPAAQKGGTLLHDTGPFLLSMADGSTMITIQHLAQGLGALVGIGLVMAVFELTRPLKSGWAQWFSVLAGLGFAVTAVDNLRIIVVEPIRASLYVAGDAATRSAVEATKCFVSIDPVMWLGYGLVGIWAFATSFQGLRRLAFPKVLAIVGMITGVFYFFIEVGTLLKNELLLTVTAGVGALVLGPVWYIWLGRILRSRAVADQAWPADRAG